jgi:Protein of unknown function (DUF4435)
MRSITAHLDGHTVAADIRAQRQVHKGAIVLVEGKDDLRRFSNIFDDKSCCIVIAHNKKNVCEAMELLADDGFPGVLGFVDADFDRIDGKELDQESIVYSVSHDFDLDSVLTDALRRYLVEVCDTMKLEQLGGHEGALVHLLSSIRPVSILRWINQHRRLGYRLRDLNFDHFFDGCQVNIDALVASVSNQKFSGPQHQQRLKALINNYVTREYNIYQLTSGHDFCQALGIALRALLGTRKPSQTYGSEIELHLRLTVNLADMIATGLIQKIQEWEDANPGYHIMPSETPSTGTRQLNDNSNISSVRRGEFS